MVTPGTLELSSGVHKPLLQERVEVDRPGDEEGGQLATGEDSHRAPATSACLQGDAHMHPASAELH